MNEVKIKPLSEDFVMPHKSSDGSAAYDVFLPKDVYLMDVDKKTRRIMIPLDFAIEVPKGMCLTMQTRSGYASKGLPAYDRNDEFHRVDGDVLLGLIDSDYRGNVGVMLRIADNDDYNWWHLKKGMKIAQMRFEYVPETMLIEAEELSDTERGEDGFGKHDGE